MYELEHSVMMGEIKGYLHKIFSYACESECKNCLLNQQTKVEQANSLCNLLNQMRMRLGVEIVEPFANGDTNDLIDMVMIGELKGLVDNFNNISCTGLTCDEKECIFAAKASAYHDRTICEVFLLLRDMLIWNSEDN